MSKELKVGAFVLASLLIFLGTLVYVDQLSGVQLRFRTELTSNMRAGRRPWLPGAIRRHESRLNNRYPPVA